MPYGYFMLVRFVMMVAFGVLAYRYYMLHKHIAMWVFVILSLLFQPFYKIILGRAMWNAVDVVVAAFLIILFFTERKLGKTHTKDYQPLPNGNDPKLDNRIKFRIGGKLSPKELLFVATEEDKQLTELFEKNPELLEDDRLPYYIFTFTHKAPKEKGSHTVPRSIFVRRRTC